MSRPFAYGTTLAALSDFRVGDQQCAVSFKGPGYSADAFIDRRSGRYELGETWLGPIATAAVVLLIIGCALSFFAYVAFVP